MRSVDFLHRWLGFAVLCLAVTGCASLNETFSGLKESIARVGATPAPEEVKPAQVAASAPSIAASAAPAQAESAPNVVASANQEDAPPPVSAAAQHAFDEARRAMRAGRTAEAERGFKALTVSHPELGGAHANLGLIYRHAGKGAEAVAALEKAVVASPGQPIFFNQLGIAYRELGQFRKARDAYERSISLDSNYAAPHLNLGILHDLYLWDGKRALELYARYLALSPAGDTTVTKWVADLKNRKPQHALLARKEKE